MLKLGKPDLEIRIVNPPYFGSYNPGSRCVGGYSDPGNYGIKYPHSPTNHSLGIRHTKILFMHASTHKIPYMRTYKRNRD